MALFDKSMFSWRSGSGYRIGVDIASSSVKLVEISIRGGKYLLENYAVVPLAKDLIQDGNISNVQVVGDAVRRGMKTMGAHTKNIAIALPSSTAITKKITVPANQNEEDLELTVETEANQSIPFPLDEVNLDYWVIGPAPQMPGEVEVLIAAARREKVEDYAAVAESGGAKPIIVDIESLAVQNAYDALAPALAGKGRGKNIALFDMGVSNTRFYVFRDGDILFSRDLNFGGNQLTVDIQRAYSLPGPEAEKAKINGGLPESYIGDVLRPYMDNVAMEVARALQFFSTTTTYGQVQQIVLSGGGSLLSGLDRTVTQQAAVPVMIANPFVAMKVSNRVRPQQLGKDAPLLVTATGLALRSF